MRGEPPHLEGPSDAPGRLTSYPTSGKVQITSEATKYFEAANLDAVQVQSKRDLFGDLRRRFPNAWHALSLLSGSSENEIACELPIVEAESMDSSASKGEVEHHYVVASGIDPRLDVHLVDMLRQIKLREVQMFFSPSFKFITRNPEKLLFVIDYVLRYGGTLMMLNYLLSPTYLARRNPLIRPAHYTSEIEVQVASPKGLSDDTRSCWLRCLVMADIERRSSGGTAPRCRSLRQTE